MDMKELIREGPAPCLRWNSILISLCMGGCAVCLKRDAVSKRSCVLYAPCRRTAQSAGYWMRAVELCCHRQRTRAHRRTLWPYFPPNHLALFGTSKADRSGAGRAVRLLGRFYQCRVSFDSGVFCDGVCQGTHGVCAEEVSQGIEPGGVLVAISEGIAADLPGP